MFQLEGNVMTLSAWCVRFEMCTRGVGAAGSRDKTRGCLKAAALTLVSEGQRPRLFRTFI